MNKVFVVVLICSFLSAQFFDEEPTIYDNKILSLKDSLPTNMPIIKNIFWSEEGVFRKLNLAPESRLEELKLRHKMMQLHQKTALVNLGLMILRPL